MIKRLSAQKVERTRKPGYYGDGNGLYLVIKTGDSKSWVYRFKSKGRSHEMGLGSYVTVSLAEAREKALECRKIRDKGIDPIAARREQRDTRVMTFRDCAEAYIEAHRKGWKNAKHAAQWPSTLATYVYPVCGDLPVRDVDLGHVMRAIEPIWHSKTETASRVRGRIEAVLDWATVRKHRSGENPARWRGHLSHLLSAPGKVSKVKHLAALPYSELPEFMTKLRERRGRGARVLEFAILTVARSGQARGAVWSEINLQGRLWTIPAERMKEPREHRVPLSEPALAILGEPLADGLVFPGARAGRPISDMTLAMTLRRMGRADLTVHGFRSTFSDWCAETTTHSPEVREMALAHAVSDKVEAAYRRGDLFEKRRALAEAWGAYCTKKL
jgi:integrase